MLCQYNSSRRKASVHSLAVSDDTRLCGGKRNIVGSGQELEKVCMHGLEEDCSWPHIQDRILTLRLLDLRIVPLRWNELRQDLYIN
jgi:hypothetical protein